VTSEAQYSCQESLNDHTSTCE